MADLRKAVQYRSFFVEAARRAGLPGVEAELDRMTDVAIVQRMQAIENLGVSMQRAGRELGLALARMTEALRPLAEYAQRHCLD